MIAARLEDRTPVPYFLLYAVFFLWFAVSAVVELARDPTHAASPPFVFGMGAGLVATLGQAWCFQRVLEGKKISRATPAAMLWCVGGTWVIFMCLGPHRVVVATPTGIYAGAVAGLTGLFTPLVVVRTASILRNAAALREYYAGEPMRPNLPAVPTVAVV